MPDRDWQADVARLQACERKSLAILGVNKDADAETIRRAFRRASMVHHPDRNANDGEAARRFHLVHCAYKFLAEGEMSAALAEAEDPAAPGAERHDDGRPNNPWAYWCWWREKFGT